MKKFYNQRHRLVRKDGIIMWEIVNQYMTTTRPPWYRFWEPTKYDIENDTPKYIDIPEVKE